MDKAKTLARFRQLYEEYGWIVMGEKPKRELPEEYKSAIGDLLGMVLFMDEQSKNIIVLADLAVAEAREVENAITSTEEGREFVDYLKRSRPELFPLKNRRVHTHGHA